MLNVHVYIQMLNPLPYPYSEQNIEKYRVTFLRNIIKYNLNDPLKYEIESRKEMR